MYTNHEQFFVDARNAAARAGHPFPAAAACEAALESSWGVSQLARQANNLLGIKQHQHHAYEDIFLPTREWVKNSTYPNGTFVVVNADFVKYPSWDDCFRDCVAMLHRMSCYAPALTAPDVESFERAVAAHWSTDPHRADKVLAIYHLINPSGAVQ